MVSLMKVEIKKVAVIGAGVMGHGIAQVFAMNGYEVNLLDISSEILNKAIEKIKWSLSKFVEKRRIKQGDADAALSRIKTMVEYEKAARDVDFIIEAVLENIKLKKEVFSKLDSIAPKHAILASNTSTLSITEMGRATRRPDMVVGMHWFNPPQLMQLIEVIKGDDTRDDVIDTTIKLSEKLGKTPILCKKDVRGFIVNRVLANVFNDAFWAYYRSETSKEGIDSSIKYTGGFPMGLFELADFVGLDILYEVGKSLYEAYGERVKPCSELVEPLIKERKLGQKAGVGFYDWTKGRPRLPLDLADEYDVNRSWAVSVNEAAWLIYEDVAEPKDIDTGMKLGTGWPSGPCEYADRKGLDYELNKLRELYRRYGMEMYKPCPLLEEYVKKGWVGRKAKRGFYSYG